MENNKNKKPQKPKVNIYWVYGIVITVLLGMSFFGGNSSFKNIGKTNTNKNIRTYSRCVTQNRRTIKSYRKKC